MGFAESVVKNITSSRLECPVPEGRNCTAPRDTLLPKLISGELRMKDAERIIEVAERPGMFNR